MMRGMKAKKKLAAEDRMRWLDELAEDVTGVSPEQFRLAYWVVRYADDEALRRAMVAFDATKEKPCGQTKH